MLRLTSALALLLLAGCVYSFTGGGVPRHIRTVAVLPFENQTTQPILGTEVQQALQREMQRALGLRLAEESVADAVVRGRITDYQEIAAGIRPSNGTAGNTRPDVLQTQVQITFSAEIYDLRQDQPLWEGTSVLVTGSYQPDREQVSAAVTKAIQDLVKKVSDGARSQW